MESKIIDFTLADSESVRKIKGKLHFNEDSIGISFFDDNKNTVVVSIYKGKANIVVYPIMSEPLFSLDF